MKKYLMTIISVLALLMLLAGCSGGSSSSSGESNGNYVLATLQEGSSWYVYGATMSKVLREDVENINTVDVLPYSGGIGNVELVTSGKADLGLTFSVTNNWGLNGIVGFDKKYDNFSLLVGGLDQYYVGIIMRNDFMEKYNIDSIADLKEEEVPVNLYTYNTGSQGEFAAKQVLEAYGMTYKEIEEYGGSIEHTSNDVIKTAFQDGNGDMFIQVMTKGHPGFTEIALQTPVTFMSIEDEYREKLEETGNQKATFPACQYKGQDEEIETIGFNTTLVANKDLSEETAYEITKAIVENKENLAQGHQGLSDFDAQAGIDEYYTGGLQLHQGALKYYEEQGWK